MTMANINDLLESIRSSSGEKGEKSVNNDKKRAHPPPHSYALRISPNKKNTFYCTLPDCSHCLNIEHQVIGKKTLCHSCLSREFIIGDDLITSCEACR